MSEGKVMEGESSVGDGEGPGVVFRKGEGTEGGEKAEGGEWGKRRGRGRERRGGGRVKCLRG